MNAEKKCKHYYGGMCVIRGCGILKEENPYVEKNCKDCLLYGGCNDCFFFNGTDCKLRLKEYVSKDSKGVQNDRNCK